MNCGYCGLQIKKTVVASGKPFFATHVRCFLRAWTHGEITDMTVPEWLKTEKE